LKHRKIFSTLKKGDLCYFTGGQIDFFNRMKLNAIFNGILLLKLFLSYEVAVTGKGGKMAGVSKLN